MEKNFSTNNRNLMGKYSSLSSQSYCKILKLPNKAETTWKIGTDLHHWNTSVFLKNQVSYWTGNWKTLIKIAGILWKKSLIKIAGVYWKMFKIPCFIKLPEFNKETFKSLSLVNWKRAGIT